MKKVCAGILVLVLFSVSAFSQVAKKPNPYKFGIGGGFYPELDKQYAVSVKFYTRQGYSLDFIGYDLKESYRLTCLFSPNISLNRQGNLRFIIGPGLHVGVWKEEFKTNSYTTNPIIGGDGIIGFEYRIPKVPLSFQVHFQPSVDVVGNNEFQYGKEWAGGIVRFVF